MGSDGSLILDTGIDTSGLAAGSKEMMRAIQSFGKKAAKTIKQTVKSVIATIAGVGSVLSVLSKSVSSYMSTHWQTAAKLEACWQAVGEVIGPVIERVVDLIQMAVSYLIDFLYYVGLSSKTAKQASADAKAAAQAMKKSLMGFDELNLLQKDTTTTLGDYELPDWLKEIAELLKGGYFEEAGRVLARKLNEMVEQIDWTALGEKISYYFKGALMFLYGLIDEFDWNNLGLKIKEMLEAIDWQGIFEAAALVILAAFKGAVEFLWGLLGNELEDERFEKFLKAYDELKESVLTAIDKIGKAINTLWKKYAKPFFDWLIADALPVVMQLVTVLIDTIGRFADVISGDMSLSEFVQETKNAFMSLIPDDIKEKITTKINDIKDAFKSLLSDPSGALSKAGAFIRRFVDELDWEGIGEAIKGVLEKIPWAEIQQGIVDAIFEAIKAAFKVAWGLMGGDEEDLAEVLTSLDNLKKKIQEVKEKITEFIQNDLIPFIQEKMPDIINAIGSVVDLIGKIVDLISGDISLSEFFEGLDGVQSTIVKILATILVMKTTITGLGIAKKVSDLLRSLGLIPTKLDAATTSASGFHSIFSKIKEVIDLTAGGAGTFGESFEAVFGTSLSTIGTILSAAGEVGAAFYVCSQVADGLEEKSSQAKQNCDELAESYTNETEAMVAQFELLFDTVAERRNSVMNSGDNSDIEARLAGIRESINETINTYVDASVKASEATSLSSEQVNTLKEQISGLVTAYEEKIRITTTSQEAEALSIELQEEINELMSSYGLILNEQGKIVKATAEEISGASKSTSDLVDKVNEGTASAKEYSDANDDVTTSLEGLGTEEDNAETDITEYVAKVKEQIDKAVESISGYDESVTTDLDSVDTTLDESAEDMKDFSSSVDDTLDETVQSMSNLKSRITTIMSGISSQAYNWGSDIGTNIARGLRSSTSQVASAASNVASIIRSYLHFSEPDEGPLSDFHTYMPDMIKEMVSGIESNKGLLTDAVKGIADDISEEVSNGDYSFKSMEVDLTGGMTNFSNTIISGFENLIENLNTIAEKVTFKMPEVAMGTITPYGNLSVDTSTDNTTLTMLSASVNELQDMFKKFTEDYKENSNRTTDIKLDGISVARGLYKYNKTVEQEHGISFVR